MEEWKPIEGYEGNYSVSSLGRIKSEARIEKIGNSERSRSETIMKQRIGFDGHYFVELYKDNVVKRLFVHRIVYQTFCGQLIKGQIIHHKDHDKLNNDSTNLQQMTTADHNNHHKLVKHEGVQGFRDEKRRKMEEFKKQRRGIK